MAVAFFSLSLLFMIWISQDFIRVFGGARGLPGWHVLASPPLSSPFTHAPLRYPFPLPPTAASATKLIVSLHFTPARRHAQPLLAARARFSRSWDRGRERGGGTVGLTRVLGELSATNHGPVPLWFPFSCFFLPYPLFLVVLYPMLQSGEPLGYWKSLLPGRVLSQMNF